MRSLNFPQYKLSLPSIFVSLLIFSLIKLASTTCTQGTCSIPGYECKEKHKSIMSRAAIIEDWNHIEPEVIHIVKDPSNPGKDSRPMDNRPQVFVEGNTIWIYTKPEIVIMKNTNKDMFDPTGERLQLDYGAFLLQNIKDLENEIPKTKKK